MGDCSNFIFWYKWCRTWRRAISGILKGCLPLPPYNISSQFIMASNFNFYPMFNILDEGKKEMSLNNFERHTLSGNLSNFPTSSYSHLGNDTIVKTRAAPSEEWNWWFWGGFGYTTGGSCWHPPSLPHGGDHCSHCQSRRPSTQKFNDIKDRNIYHKDIPEIW